MHISICFWAFSNSWKEEKKKKNFCSTSVAETVGLLPNCLVKKKNFVLQPCNCIARERAEKEKKLYCNTIIVLQAGRLGWIVLQHGGKLYCRVLHCIAI